MVLYHGGVWTLTAHTRHIPWLLLLNRWDSELYTRIVLDGYDAVLRAFFPLYPALIRALGALFGGAMAVQGVGTVFSTCLLFTFVAAVERFRTAEQPAAHGLTPGTGWGWFLFLFSPASYVFHSHHTESLFLVLSFGCFAFAFQGRSLGAGVLAGLCIWTRNQGLLVAIGATLLAVSNAPTARERLRRGAPVASLAFVGGLGFLAFQCLTAGSPFAHLLAQRNWTHAESVSEMARTFWFGNDWLHPTPWIWLRLVMVVAMAVSSAWLRKTSVALAVYGLLSMAVMVPQGDFGNAFRFGAVLFPQLFVLGDRLARAPRWVQVVCGGLLLWLNHKVTHGYAIGRWAY